MLNTVLLSDKIESRHAHFHLNLRLPQRTVVYKSRQRLSLDQPHTGHQNRFFQQSAGHLCHRAICADIQYPRQKVTSLKTTVRSSERCPEPMCVPFATVISIAEKTSFLELLGKTHILNSSPAFRLSSLLYRNQASDLVVKSLKLRAAVVIVI